MISYQDLSEYLDPETQPHLDHPQVAANSDKLHDIQRLWCENGVVVVPKLLPDDLISKYIALRRKLVDSQGFKTGGFQMPVPYMFYKEIRDLALYEPVMKIMEALVGEPVGLHLNLTGFVSTERDWHADTFLNPAEVGGWYVACWMALDDIHPDSGPFEFVPKSHRWPVMTREKIFKHLTQEEISRPDWPAIAERITVPALLQKQQDTGLQSYEFTADKGDVLFWHSNLMHRGSKPKNRDLERLSLISHYSGINHRKDMPEKAQWTNGQWLFLHPQHRLDPGSPTPSI